MTWPFGDLKMFGYDMIMVDVPAPFDLYSSAGDEKSPAAQYDIMTWEQIAALPIGQLARGDALLLAWCCAPSMIRFANLVERDWGAVYKSRVNWRKMTPNGKVRVGPGYRVRTMDETCLLFTFGNPQHKPLPSSFDGLAREHSRKPDEFYRICERAMPKAYRADLFSRQRRPGWDSWGNEVDKFSPESPAKSKTVDTGAAGTPTSRSTESTAT